MEPIEDHPCVGQMLSDRLHVTSCHIDGYVGDLATPLFAEELEELAENGCTPALAGPNHTTTIVVDDHGQIPMAIAVAELIDADAANSIEPTGSSRSATTRSTIDPTARHDSPRR